MLDDKNKIVDGEAFLDLFYLPVDLAWLAARCGTSAVNSSILGWSDPDPIIVVTPSRQLTSCPKRCLYDTSVEFREADGMTALFGAEEFDSAVMELASYYVPDQTWAAADRVKAFLSANLGQGRKPPISYLARADTTLGRLLG